VPVCGLVAERRDLVDVDVERPRRERVQPHVEPGLLTRLAQRGLGRALVVGLDMSSRLKPPPELHVVDEAGALARRVDDAGRSREVRVRLRARERLLELGCQAQHPLDVLALLGVRGIQPEQRIDE
jgi:hypothetical protein